MASPPLEHDPEKWIPIFGKDHAPIMSSIAAELLAQLALGALQRAALPGWQVLAGAVEIEGEHRQRRAIGIGLAAPAALGRALERAGDALGILAGEHTAREIERIAVARHLPRP